MIRLLTGLSASLTTKWKDFGTSSSIVQSPVLSACFAMTGASLTGRIVIDTVAVEVAPLASETV